MNVNHSSHQLMSASAVYEIYVGSITPEEFVQGCESIEQAVEWHLEGFYPTWGEEAPEWLGDRLIAYLTKKLG